MAEPERTGKNPGFIWGASAIALELGLTQRQVFHMLERGLIPATKRGAKWVTTRAALDALAAEIEGKAA